MGLDNIPKSYPCVAKNVAIKDEEGRIDCLETIDAGLCPHHNMKNSDPLVKDAIIPIGMFGTNCWYRGKYGVYLLDEMLKFNNSFPYSGDILYGNEYGDEPDGISEEDCIDISKAMSEYTESWIRYVQTYSDVKGNREEEQNLINDWIYLAWWLNFVGTECEGSAVWY